jgi:HEAT repeat protein
MALVLFLGAILLFSLFGLRAGYFALLVDLGIRPVPWLINGMAARDEKERTVSINALARIGDECIPAVIAALNSPNGRLREGAAITLGRMANWQSEPGRRNPEGILRKLAVNPLVDRLSDSDPRVRVQAAVALWYITTDASLVVPVLIHSLNEEDGEASFFAVEGLETIGPEAIPALEKARHGEDEKVRKGAAEVLWRINGP